VLKLTTIAALIASLALSGVSAAASEGSGWRVDPVVTGLKTPRGIAFDGSGGMYVAESGLPGSGPFGVTETGAVDKYVLDDIGATRIWSTPFKSLFSNERGSDVLGPEGLSVAGNGCKRSGDGHGDGCQVLMIMSESQQGLLESVHMSVPQIGHLFGLDSATGRATDLSNVGDQEYEWTRQHKALWEEFPDSNPYGVLATGGRKGRPATYVVDAGANTVSEVAKDGTIRVIAYIPNETPIPSIPGLPTRDATPTCAAQGPDGALYIATLDLARNFFVIPGQGQSHVYRVDPREHENYLTAAHLWASGLTTVTSCTFDGDGNFWATEMFKFNRSGPLGDLVMIPFDSPTHLRHIGGGQLPFPGGIAQGPDGAMYVTVNSAGPAAANGAVMRVSD